MTWQQGVPIVQPVWGNGCRKREVDRYGLRHAKVGDSKFIPDVTYHDVRYSTRYFTDKWKVTLVVRQVEERGQQGVRIWRIK
jgi:hypothetical protein